MRTAIVESCPIILSVAIATNQIQRFGLNTYIL